MCISIIQRRIKVGNKILEKLEARVANLEKSRVIKSLEKKLENLKLLDENINEVVESYEKSYKLASKKLDPEIKNNLDLIKKSKLGLRKAQYAQRDALNILSFMPEDKTLLRIVKDFKTLVSKFERNIEKSEKIIDKLSKNILPDEMLKTHRSISRRIKKLLIDPKLLKVSYLAEDYDNGKATKFTIRYLLPFKRKNIEKPVLTNVFSLVQFIGPKVLPDLGIHFFEQSSILWEITVKELLPKFKKEMKGQTILKDEIEKNKKREQVANDMIFFINQVARQVGDTYGRSATLSSNGYEIEADTRTEYDYADYGQYEEPEFPDYSKLLEKSLKKHRFMEYVEEVKGEYGEKGWYYFKVRLK